VAGADDDDVVVRFARHGSPVGAWVSWARL
jgi:hypothetical protein